MFGSGIDSFKSRTDIFSVKEETSDVSYPPAEKRNTLEFFLGDKTKRAVYDSLKYDDIKVASVISNEKDTSIRRNLR